MNLKSDLRARLSAKGLRPDRRFGQNFLIDEDALRQIADAVGPTDVGVVEIGPGPGSLTAFLVERIEDVVVVEKDRRMIPLLEARFSDRIVIVEGDALEVDLSAWGRGRAVAGNIPYLISSPLLFRLIEGREALGSVTLMVQREVADRWLASPGTKAYGIPSVLLQVHAEPARVLEVSRESFWPAPQVDSTVVHWRWREAPAAGGGDLKHFSAVVRAAFSQRRKKLKNALAPKFGPERVDRAGRFVDLDRRAETLSVDEFGLLAEGLAG